MIDWEKVKAHLNNYLMDMGEYDYYFDDLYCLLYYLYNEKGLSLEKIASLTNGYISSRTIRNKMDELKMKRRPRGGFNFRGKVLDMEEEEYIETSNTQLARKLKVSRECVINFAKRMGWPIKKAGRPRD